jgi:tetratricopeptide (TPR) repeat protein
MRSIRRLLGRRARRLARAERLERAERWGAAASAYRSALAWNDRDAHVHFRLGRALEKSGNLIGAVTAYQSAIARDGQHDRWHFRLGRALEQTGQVAAARHAYRRAEKLQPRPPKVEGRRGKQLPYLKRAELGVLPKAAYAYGVFRAARDAEALGITRITAIEFGVAGGRGLLRLEQHAADVETMTGDKIDVVGFDTGEGLLAAADHRDMPYGFAEGSYRMDEETLRGRLERAELILGDATETFPRFLASSPATIGFMSFDMDHYTPTAAVLGRVGDEAIHHRFLPRAAVYFDDVVGPFGRDYNDFTGELLAIHEFNRDHDRIKIAEDRHFRTLQHNLSWHHSMYVMHRFAHPEYGRYLGGDRTHNLALR